ncbi:hypothetical protein BT96DRAFT_961680 [Gymnopus androsaceus JB14]|uniref:Uncharacterized protein n=1 Tax=Gymnopus androsaceus JB14 TaxID=1447944 RepID=A0A6A4IS58_9AGAR|nr:hypothetical protein BT96DRAFT_961680 [Gymnopus androsaceus JB14]
MNSYHTYPNSATPNTFLPPSCPPIKTESSQICLSASANPPPLSSDSNRAAGSAGSSALRDGVVHPYARLYAKREEAKRRKIWSHAFEKSLFDPSTLGSPHRRTIYQASLEAHVDRLHAQLLSLGFWPVPLDQLEPFKGLNSKTAKSMVAGLQYNSSQLKLKLLELERANEGLERTLMNKKAGI